MSQKNNILKFPTPNRDFAIAELRRIVARSLLKALELKDRYTYEHSLRVAYFGLVLGHQLGLSPENLEFLELSCLFHDIGKIGVPDKVLQKPERLDEQEFQIMKQHPEKSDELLLSITELRELATMARHHHERFDGRGYPDKLKGEEIPLFARIILIADTFDAMTSTRPYRAGLENEIAFQELKEFAGSQFDPNLVDAFIRGMKIEEGSSDNTFYLATLDEKIYKKAA